MDQTERMRVDLIGITPELGTVLERLTRAGGRPVIVGGSVRDALLGTPSNDVDVECYSLSYRDLTEALADLGRVDLVGASFGVLKYTTDTLSVDISLPRRDNKVGVGHRGFEVDVDHTLSFVEASARRDFTINAIGWNPATGELLDPHAGRADLEARVLRHVSNAFGEDPLRVLRGVQLAGRFDMAFHPDTAELCRSMFDTFHQLPVERVWGEWKKLGSLAVRPSRSLQAMRDCGWLDHHPDLTAIEGVPQDPRWHPEGDVEVHTAEAVDAAAAWCDIRGIDGDDRMLTVLTTMLHDLGKATHTQRQPDGRITSYGHAEAGVEPALRFLRSIGAPSELISKVGPIVREHMCVACAPESVTPAAVRRLARRLAPASLVEWARVVEADHLGRGSASHAGITDRWLQLGEAADVAGGVVKPHLKGEMLMVLGLVPGPQFAQIINASRDAQDDGVIHNHDTAVAWAAQYVADHGLT